MNLCYNSQSILALSILYYKGGTTMAECCVECWNKIMNTNDSPKKFVVSRELDLCEECGQWKPVIIRLKRKYIIAEWIREVTDCRTHRM